MVQVSSLTAESAGNAEEIKDGALAFCIIDCLTSACFAFCAREREANLAVAAGGCL
jgi:hypothetical protein